MATIKDVAKEAGVSIATVSRVINQNGYVNRATEKQVMKAIEKLNYVPNEVARSLSKKKSNIIALIVPAIDNPFFAKLAKSIETAAQAEGYKIFLCNTDDNKERLHEYLDSILHGFVDGVIINSQNITKKDLIGLKENSIPLITLDRIISNELTSTISVNNLKGGSIAAKHLLDIGCKRIGHLRGPKNINTADNRFFGFKEIVKSFDWYDDSWIEETKFNVEDGEKAMKKLYKRHPDIDGVFAANDLVAVGALKAANDLGLRVPNDLAIVGFDGIDLSDLVVPRITTLQQPIDEIGKLAIDELIRIMKNPDTYVNNIKFEVKLIKRESTLVKK